MNNISTDVDKNIKTDVIEDIRTIGKFLSIIPPPNTVVDTRKDLPEAPISTINRVIAFVEKEVTVKLYHEKNNNGGDGGDLSSLLLALEQVSKLTTALGEFPSNSSYGRAIIHTVSVLQRTMAVLEEEFRLLLEEVGDDKDSSSEILEGDVLERLKKIANIMIAAGYDTDCCQVFSIVRRGKIEATLMEIGFGKIQPEELQNMAWDVLESEIASWIMAFKHMVSVSFPTERDLCEKVFSDHYSTVSDGLFSNLVRGVVIKLLNFTEHVTMTKRSEEKLFKFLDMYETMRDLTPTLNKLFSGHGKQHDQKEKEEEEEEEDGSLPSTELKCEMSAAKIHIGKPIIGMFTDLENSIKCDNGRIPVPGGAVHPLTRYVMNYLKYALEYKNTLEQVFKERHESESSDVGDYRQSTPVSFSEQVMAIMNLLDTSLDRNSNLYKDPSLSYIFLMNNGRYIVQKIKSWSEIKELLGENWCRKKSSELRQYHKNYQRETWGKVLNCFKEEGLRLKGTSSSTGAVSKSALRERFKLFNSIFEDIYKTQSTWILSDEQLQSELRVSVQAVVVPAYRSFLGRFRQYIESGKHPERYIKFAPEDLENCIDGLFDGTSSSIVRGRK
ncbi:exocyst subunit exo70 family protein C1 [Zostera marina]|uniref:Exocyst subunit Exo70 family protein n=1 Tax=Zostera marina TaxID=29655 RepID=A0A0K9PNN8_ZOSMR|nr:exocyst subunit exo70 family protein C1 [Zostera marina]